MSRFLLGTLLASVLAPAAALVAIDGSYLKVNAGYSWTDRHGANCHASSDRSTSVSAQGVRMNNTVPVGIALGHQIDENWCSELAVDYRHGGRYRLSSDGADKATGRYNNLTALVNFYYDFPLASSRLTAYNMTPYLGVGVGVASNKTRNANWNDTNSSYKEGPRRIQRLAWNAMIGVRQRVNEGCSVDLGYRFANLGSIRNNGRFNDGTSGASTEVRRIYAHEVVLGIIFHQ